MALCPHCETELAYVETELIELRGYEDVVEDVEIEEGPGQAVASVCPDCGTLLDL